MEQKDAKLIQRILEGDQDAFSPLVNKYQKGVHALAWRKVGDFHIAQEIAQDAFLKAYQKLGTLKSYESFGGWLYVIASNLCLDWLRKNPPPEQSLEVTDASEVNQVSYSRYIAGKQAAEADETRREVVKKLLQKLPESERTVMTLHYLGEMTIKTISEFLGVSPNTVKSRLNRARNRLKKEEDMIRQNLGSFQLPAQLAENIMREISRMTPTAPATNKPVIPWALSAASAVLIFLLMGVGTQYLSRFQKPYDLNATSERTVEIIEAAFVLDSPAKPAVRNQAGSSTTPGKRPGAGQKPDARLFAAAIDETEVSTLKPQWIQTKGPEGGLVNSLFTTISGDIYAGTPTSLYKLADDARTWRLVNARSASSLGIQDWIAGGIQMTEHGDILYLATDTEVLASTDRGETWDSLGTHSEGAPRGLAVTDAGFYIAFIEDIFFSEDNQTAWVSLKDGLETGKIRGLASVENTVFVGTDTGLYRRNAEAWEQLSVGPADKRGQKLTVHALAASEHRLYVAAGWEFTNEIGTQRKAIMTGDNWWSVYRSTDLGDTWYTINPRKRTENERKPKGGISTLFPPKGANSTPVDFTYSNFKIITSGAKVMLAHPRELFYSVNAGETWTSLDLKDRSAGVNNIAPPIVMLDADTFYRGSQAGVYRTTDAGESWHQLNTGLAGTTVMDLFSINGKLYASEMDGLVTSTDGGESWTPFTVDAPPMGGISVFRKFDDVLYMKGMAVIKPQILRLSTEGDKFIPIPGIPKILEKVDPLNNELTGRLNRKSEKAARDMLTDIAKQDLENGEVLDTKEIEEASKAAHQMVQESIGTAMPSMFGNFSVSGETYYVEYKQKLFRWKSGTDAWYNTGLVDKGESFISTLMSTPFDYSAGTSLFSDVFNSMGFKLAVANKTVYVGKRDGHLSQSFDEGETWNDVTADLPFPVEKFNAIAFAGSTVYVATDKGVAYSSDGTQWHEAVDIEGSPLVIEKIVVDGTKVYGTSGQYVYQAKGDSGTWEQVTPEIPDTVLSFDVDGNTLYVGTSSSGVLRFTLDE